MNDPVAREFPKVGTYRQDIVKSGDGLNWVIGRGSQDGLAVNHEMVPAGNSIHDWICAQFKPGLVFLDIGAHVGHYTVRAAAAGCQVYAVEANPESAAQLRLNLHMNRLQATLWAFAAWDRRELLDYGHTGPAGVTGMVRNGSATLASPAGHQPMGIKVAGLPLDVLLGQLGRLDIVKMDVEGADLQVIDGMMASLIDLKPLLIFESHLFYGTYTEDEMNDREHQLTIYGGYEWCDLTDLGVKSPERFRIGRPSIQ